MSLPRSKFEEEACINNHTTVWGSWWKDHQWGYKCCKQTIRNSYCTGAAGIEAAEASADLMKANIAHKEAAEDTHASMEEKKTRRRRGAMFLRTAKEEKRREEKDERKRKYNVKYNDEVTLEDMETYMVKRIHHDDPMKDFLHRVWYVAKLLTSLGRKHYLDLVLVLGGNAYDSCLFENRITMKSLILVLYKVFFFYEFSTLTTSCSTPHHPYKKNICWGDTGELESISGGVITL